MKSNYPVEVINPEDRLTSEVIARQTAEYLAAGNAIITVAPGETAFAHLNISAAVTRKYPKNEDADYD